MSKIFLAKIRWGLWFESIRIHLITDLKPQPPREDKNLKIQNTTKTAINNKNNRVIILAFVPNSLIGTPFKLLNITENKMKKTNGNININIQKKRTPAGALLAFAQKREYLQNNP